MSFYKYWKYALRVQVLTAALAIPSVAYWTSDAQDVILFSMATSLRSLFVTDTTLASRRARAARGLCSGSAVNLKPEDALVRYRETLAKSSLKVPNWASYELTDLGNVGAWKVAYKGTDDVPLESDPITMIYAHGGRLVAGTADSYAALLSTWTVALNAEIAVVDHPLMPETSFETILKAFEKAYVGCLSKTGDSKKIIMAADGAGAIPLLWTLFRLHENGHELPAGVVLLSPSTDLVGLPKPMKDRLITRKSYELLAGLVGPVSKRKEISPLWAEEKKFEGLPPVMLVYDEKDLAAQEVQALEKRLKGSNVPVQTICRKGLWPNFLFVYYLFPEGQEDMAAVRSFIDRATMRNLPANSDTVRGMPQHPLKRWFMTQLNNKKGNNTVQT